MYIIKKKAEESGEQHLDDRSGTKKFPCFKCERVKLECLDARNCKQEKKADSSDVNSKKAIEILFKEKKEAKTRHRKSMSG